jgi:simple sugar transport system ATP-binding protein
MQGAPAATPPRLSLRGIRKAYPSVVANDRIDLDVAPGEIHAVLGENGAGKSTLMKIIYGVVKPDAGEIRWEGRPVEIANPHAARTLGIGMVFQHFSLFETLTVTENVALAIDGARDLAALARRIEEVSSRYGLPLDPRRLVHSLSVGERQRVEIVRCLLQAPRLLIMDEPTSVLTPQAVGKLFETLRQLAAEGCSILYISHKLDEIKALCTGATVLRGGRVTGTCDPRQETASSMARMMIGKDLPVCEHAEAAAGGEPRLVVAGLSHKSDDPFGTDLEDVHLTVHAGEILGIAGVSGNGQQELLCALSGEAPLAEPFPIRLLGAEVGRMHPGRRRKLGLGFVPEERLGRGAVPNMSLAENALLTAHRAGAMVRGGLVRAERTTAFARECIERFTVKCGGPEAEARSLSGGNLQKFIVGREVLQAPKVLVVAQPTWGVDVGAAAFIRQSLIDLRNRGTAILVISEELDELFEICDRIAVIAKGRLSPAKRTRETNVEEIGVWMSGLWPGAGADEMPAQAGVSHAPA